MLHNRLVRMQPYLGLEHNKQGDRIQEPASQSDMWRISETKFSEHNSISYWDEAMAMGRIFKTSY